MHSWNGIHSIQSNEMSVSLQSSCDEQAHFVHEQTVETLNKGHKLFGIMSIVPCREVVLISEGQGGDQNGCHYLLFEVLLCFPGGCEVAFVAVRDAVDRGK